MTTQQAVPCPPDDSRPRDGLERPMLARLYNAALCGTDNYEADRLLHANLHAAVPKIDFTFESEAQFVNRAVRYLATTHRVKQWVIAVPWSLPQPTVHHVGGLICGPDYDARVWYVEPEPVIAAHMRALVGEEDSEGQIRVVEADPLEPAAMHDALHRHPTPPEDGKIGLVLGGVLAFHPGTRAEAAAVAQQHIARLPAGSFVVLTHLLDPEDPELTPAAHALQSTLLRSGLNAGSVATRADIRAMVSSARILKPGVGMPPDVVPATDWWRGGPSLEPEPLSSQLVGAVVATTDSRRQLA